MKEKIYDFYLKRSTFLFFAIVSMIFWLAWGVSVVVEDNPIKLLIFALLFFVLTAGLTLTYLKGEINLQKMLLGSLLFFLIVDYIEVVDAKYSFNMVSSAIISAFILVILIVFFICHMLQQLDHTGKKIIVIINQSCPLAFLFAIIFLTDCVVRGYITSADYTFVFAVMCTLFLISCMETRISEYKYIRAKHKEKGDWNEENRKEAKKLFKL